MRIETPVPFAWRNTTTINASSVLFSVDTDPASRYNFQRKNCYFQNLVLEQAPKQKLPDVPEGIRQRSDHQALLAAFKTVFEF